MWTNAQPAIASSPEASGRPRWQLALAGLLLAAEGYGVAAALHPWFRIEQPLAGPIVFLGAFLWFGRKPLRRQPRPESHPVSSALWSHAAAAALVTLSTFLLYSSLAAHPAARLSLTLVWIAALLALPLTLLAAWFPLRRWVQSARDLGPSAAIAFVLASLAIGARLWLRLLWNTPDSAFGKLLISITLRLTRAGLLLLHYSVVSDPSTATLGTPRFTVQVAGLCSGVEGMALILVLTLGYLAVSHRELRLARAAWLVPLSVLLMFGLNTVRLVTLIAIGDAGHEDISLIGFHSEAGWIAFTLAATGFLILVNRVDWLRREPSLTEQERLATVSAAAFPHTGPEALSAIYPAGGFQRPVAAAAGLPVAIGEGNSAGIGTGFAPAATAGMAAANPTARFLAPYLALTAATMVSHAASGRFEVFYPLRLVAAGVALWLCRNSFRGLGWRLTRSSAFSVAAGVALGALWIACAAFLIPATSPLGGQLAALHPATRTFWLTCRVLGAVITVPLAEELAFRGFLARWLTRRAFETVSLREISFPALLISSVVFGVLHGALWPLGVVAGLLFCGLARRTGRISDAVLAHAAANLTLAVWALTRGAFWVW